MHVEVSGASPLEYEIVRWVRRNEEALSKKVSLDYSHARQEGGRDSR